MKNKGMSNEAFVAWLFIPFVIMLVSAIVFVFIALDLMLLSMNGS